MNGSEEGYPLRTTVGLIAAAVMFAACASSTDEIDPNKQFMLAISNASVKSTNNGAAWDGDNSAPDVFARFVVNGVAADTSTVQDSYTPAWTPAEGVVVTASMLRASGVVSVQLWDADLLVSDPVTPAYSVVLSDDEINSGSVTWTNVGGVDHVTFVVVPQ